MSSLFKIEQELIQLRSLLEVEDEFSEESPEKEIIEQQLEIKQDELVTKAEGYLHVMSTLRAQADQANKEIERIQKFKQQKEHAATRLEAALLQAVLLFGEEDKKGIKRLEFGTHRLSTRRSTSVNITNEDAISDDCKLCDVTFKNLSVDVKNYLAKRINELPDSIGKSELVAKFNPGTKVSKTLIKTKIEKGEDVDWAEIQTKYSLTIK